VLCVPIPVLNLVLAWFAWRNRASLTPNMLKVWRFVLWASLAVNAALVIAALLATRYEP
jgi:hypothetical protein